MAKGRIHSFETFGTLDGPGIRFVVFMQGCPLRCIYCHNRDTWDIHGGREYTSDEVVDEMKKYLVFINLSKGGITISGGEPTLQAEFVTEVFMKCKKIAVHTALDTCGFVDVDKVKDLLQYTDLVLLDIKHAVEEKHRKITGVSNQKIREFARYTKEKGIPLWVRYVLVPGYTDSKEDLELAARFISELDNVQKIEVLPYHSMGMYKWKMSGQEYPLKEAKEPTARQVSAAMDILGHPPRQNSN